MPCCLHLIGQHYMGGEEESYPHGSAEQAVPRPQPSSFTLQREDPSLPRIHADDQDKKTICLFWSLLLGLLILMAILANYAVPSIYIKNNLGRSLSGSSIANCNNPSGLSGTKITCGSNALYFGQVVVGWGPINQFGLLYLQARPSNLSQPIQIHQKYKLRLIPLNIRSNNNAPFDFEVAGPAGELNATIDFSSTNADLLYGDDGETVIGYRYLLAIIIHFEEQPFAEQVQFSQPLNLNGTTLRLQSYAINQRFTTYTIVVRYVFFGIAIVGLILYIMRFVKVPAERRTIEQKMVAVASVLLIMFNDPFYPITVLKPNGVSAFFSLIFVINLIAFLLLLWLVAADRIYFQDGQLGTVQLTKKKIAYVALVWVLLVICLMVYTMQQVNNTPLVPHDFNRSYTMARVVIGLVFFIGIVYIAARFIRSCMAPQGRTWRSMLFMSFSCAFILAVFIIVVSNALAPYNYNGSGILVVYSMVNIYVYYLQYMFTVTREETERMVNPPAAPEQQDQYDVLTVGTIDLVDVNLDDEEQASKGSAAGRKAPGRQLEEMSSFQVDEMHGK